MDRLSIVWVVVFVLISAGSVSAADSESSADNASIIVGSDTFVLVAQDTRFDARLQLHQSVRMGVTTSRGMIRFSGGLALDKARATSPAGGYGYPGWSARVAWVGVALAPESRFAGVDLTARLVLAGFDSTFLITFFPALQVTPFVRIPLIGSTRAELGVSLGWQFRQDLRLTTRNAQLPGIPYGGINVVVSLPAPRLPQNR